MSTTNRRQRRRSKVYVPFSWVSLNQKPLNEADFLAAVRQLPAEPFLHSVIALLQFAEASDPSSSVAFPELDRLLPELFPIQQARRVADRLKTADHWIFFSRWQLLLAVKLLCAFGSRETPTGNVSMGQLLDLLLMVNDFYPGSTNPGHSEEASVKAVQEAALRQYALVQHEHPHHLIGRYAEIFNTLTSLNDAHVRVDIGNVLKTEFGVDLNMFKAILFAFYTNAVPTPQSGDEKPKPTFRTLDLEDWFSQTLLSHDQWASVVKIVGTTPDAIRKQHISSYGEHVGNPIDLGLLLRKPVIQLADGRIAAVSGHLVIQRYTCGLYWDINDALPSDEAAQPNRQAFQDFFGNLHERYGQSVLRRIVDTQKSRKRKADLIGEQDYGPGPGSNPDNLVVEFVGDKNKRCLLFEFKVGRPRYKDTIVEGDVEAFQKDLLLKIGTGLNQEIDLYQRLVTCEREIASLPTHDASKWFFVIVVTDPYPSLGILLGPLRERIAALRETANALLYGPFILSLSELEQLEMLPQKRMSELLIEWESGPDKDWPFNTFFAHRTNGAPVSNEYVAKLADDALGEIPQILFGQAAERLTLE